MRFWKFLSSSLCPEKQVNLQRCLSSLQYHLLFWAQVCLQLFFWFNVWMMIWDIMGHILTNFCPEYQLSSLQYHLGFWAQVCLQLFFWFNGTHFKKLSLREFIDHYFLTYLLLYTYLNEVGRKQQLSQKIMINDFSNINNL